MNEEKKKKSLPFGMTLIELIISIAFIATPVVQTLTIPALSYSGVIFLISRVVYSIYKKKTEDIVEKSPYFFFNIVNAVFVGLCIIFCILEMNTMGGDLHGLLSAIILIGVIPVNVALFIASILMQRVNRLSKPFLLILSYAIVFIVMLIFVLSFGIGG